MKLISKVIAMALITLLMSFPLLLHAQPSMEDDVIDNPVPFDGGVLFFVVVAVAYGVFKYYPKRKCITN